MRQVIDQLNCSLNIMLRDHKCLQIMNKLYVVRAFIEAPEPCAFIEAPEPGSSRCHKLIT